MSINPPTGRPRRSCLYMPGANPKALEKAKSLPADVVILDLEDSVAPEAKAQARETVCAAIAAGGYGAREVVVRVNALSTPWGFADIEAAAAAGPDAILVPKVDEATDIAKAHDAITAAHHHRIGLWAMIETPLSILNLKEIAASARSTALEVFVMGTNDLAKDMRCAQTPDRLPFLAALSLSVAAARAYGITPIDGVHNDIQNEQGFQDICRQGLSLGFDGKTLIHPSQIDPCNAIFAPTAQEEAWAAGVVAAFADPENAGKGVLKVDGKMTELLHLEQAKRILAIAAAIRARA
ncbi:MAG: HpcH/HpaI aldolase/citrate lyase family protein [Caulobacterales bacterium]|jgi:citrate lyase subunit beta/citryl-CoA lyase